METEKAKRSGRIKNRKRKNRHRVQAYFTSQLLTNLGMGLYCSVTAVCLVSGYCFSTVLQYIPPCTVCFPFITVLLLFRIFNIVLLLSLIHI